MIEIKALILLASAVATLAAERPTRPHILFIVADDLGWNDVSWHNRQMITPNLESLMRGGISLNQSYVQPLCSPSRNAFLTGLYPYHTGLQYSVIDVDRPSGVPLNLTLLPEVLRDAGYATHIVGKWHLGYCKWEYTPLYRGFQSFTGYYNGRGDHYYHSTDPKLDRYNGYDFREGNDVGYKYNGTHSGYVFADRAVDIIAKHDTDKPLFLYLTFQNVHSPLEVPDVYRNMYRFIKNEDRRTYSGMVTMLDEGVGNVTRALAERGMLDDTLIIFTTDNGGPTDEGANNMPLRGAKATLWEGGTRGVAFVNAPRYLLPLGNFTSNHLIHAVDWFPTIVDLVGLELSKIDRVSYALDGVSQANMLKRNVSTRSEFVYTINEISQNAAIRIDNYKLIVGNPGKNSDWYPLPEVRDHKETLKDESELKVENEAMKKLRRLSQSVDGERLFRFVAGGDQPMRLYDLDRDPIEKYDISQQRPDIVARLLDRLYEYSKTLVPAQYPPSDPAANPANFNGTWSPGWC